MKADFTEKQREIVARKMGYDGPMQMFDEYLNSSPSDAKRYSDITSMYAQKFAKGGSVNNGMMDANQIITEDVNRNDGRDPKRVLMSLRLSVIDGDTLLLRRGNSIAAIERLAPKIVAIELFTASSGPKLKGEVIQIMEEIKKNGILTVYGYSRDKEFISALQQNNYQINDSDVNEFDWRV